MTSVTNNRDFVIHLDGGSGSYRLHVSSPAGDDSLDIGIDPAALGVDLVTLQAQVLASAATSRAAVPEMERPLRQLGETLFGVVFQSSVMALFLSSRQEVERVGGRLRIVLRLHPPELAMLPWELLFSERYGGYLCRRSPMVRYVDAPEPARPLTVTPPLRILGMTALPGDLAALDVDTEQRRLQEVLAPFEASGRVSIDWVPGQSWEAAQDALYAGCQVFHFIGHGGFDTERGEGVIAFADGRGRRQLVGASKLAELLSVADPGPRLVVLNSCQTAAGSGTDVFSGTAATLVRTVPAVVAMQFAVTDDAAAVFSRAFYQALVHNRGVDEAVRAGRIALTGWNQDTLEWITPVLYLRSRETQLFDFTLPGAGAASGDDQSQPPRTAVLARYWAARSTGEWEPVIAELAALRLRLPGDKEVGDAYQDARLAARYDQGRRAERDGDWPAAVAHYRAVSQSQPAYRDTAARLAESARRGDIAALQEQLRAMFAAEEFQAVVGVADRLAEFDPAHADPDGLTTQARQRLQQSSADLAAAESIPPPIPDADTVNRVDTRIDPDQHAPEGADSQLQRGAGDDPSAQKLLNFDVAIERRDEGYRTSVIASLAGEASADFALPFSGEELEIFLRKLTASIGRLRRVRRVQSEDRQWLEEFGAKLFRAVFSGPILSCLARSRALAGTSDAGLRIRLRLPSTLASIPWEYIYDDEYGFLGLSPETTLLRYFKMPAPVRTFAVSPPLRILVMIPAPGDLAELDGEEEFNQIKVALDDLVAAGQVEVERLDAGTLAALQRQLRLREYHILHIIGHGGWDEDAQIGLLALEGPDRKARWVTGRDLGLMIRPYRSLRLVFLNAGEGARISLDDRAEGFAHALVRQGIAAVIAMQFEIPDKAALVFSRAFYQAIADDLPVDVATVEARRVMFAEGNEVEWAIPVLYLGSPDSRVFTRAQMSPQHPEASPEAEREAPAPVAAGIDGQGEAERRRQVREGAGRDAGEAARLQAAALDFLATIEKLRVGTDPIASAIPVESRLIPAADQKSATENPELELRWFPAADQPDITEEDSTDRSNWTNWTARQVENSPSSREIDIGLSHSTHRLEINIRRKIGFVSLNGEAVIRLSDITHRTHIFAIPDGQSRRKAELWVTSDRARRLDAVRLWVDGRLLYQE